MQADSFPSEPPGKPFMLLNIPLNDLGVVVAAFSTGFPGGSVVKNLPAEREPWVRSPGWGDLLEKEMETHSSILAWEIS